MLFVWHSWHYALFVFMWMFFILIIERLNIYTRNRSFLYKDFIVPIILIYTYLHIALFIFLCFVFIPEISRMCIGVVMILLLICVVVWFESRWYLFIQNEFIFNIFLGGYYLYSIAYIMHFSFLSGCSLSLLLKG